MSAELAQINLSRHLRIFPPTCEIHLFFTKRVVLVADALVSKYSFPDKTKISPRFFKKEQQTEDAISVCWGTEYTYCLPSRASNFPGKNTTYYSLSWSQTGNIWNCQKGAFLLFQTNEQISHKRSVTVRFVM